MNSLINTPSYDNILASPSQKHELGLLIALLAIFMGILALYFGVFYITNGTFVTSQNAQTFEAQV